MKLIGSLTSPYVRKVRIVLAEKKIEYEFELDSPWSPGSNVPNINPLGKIPVLVSKAYSMTGWRIGYCGAPSEIIGYVQKFQDHTTSNPASISQMAALAALKAPPESVTAMCREFKKRRDIMMQCLDKIPQVSYVRPQGAFYVFCDVSRLKMKCAVAAERILTEANVAVIPGDGFGAEGYIRLSFATSVERIQEGVQRIGAWVNKNTK